MKKSHGPAFRAARLDLAQCSACRGRAVIKGVFHDLACVQCNASGWVAAETGEALPLDVLVTQLSMRLQASDARVKFLEHEDPADRFRRIHLCKPYSAESEQYERNNRRGAGGSNYTGD
ncbi:hypothetical protein FOM00_11945 [Pseudomonas sp. ST1]|uniref:hypothetical protein n=1 Tax=Pseudomonas TaxID=286 RepID=UPI0004E1091A|nr:MULTISPECIES: hypothetical protein [Pseudomonas]KAA3536643.1 hypothetical protein DXU85_23200 [Pseudomonas savastanoi]RML75910.1 hypothetical protein ALQ90_03124 [Pseudomonas savastanoi pv. savastanoi]TSC36751.1 hypothetical protein FOM00_11945 [Pseudomonas sp. ST1]UKL12339.1 hypothetical protein HQ966_13715 [Pseudomonas savastanoi pv. savastanoi]